MTPASPVVVFGTETPFGRRVALALDRVGIAVTAVDVDLDDRVAVTDAMTGEIDGVVYAHVDPRCLEPQAFVDVDPARWDAACERQLRMLLHGVQASYAPLARSHGAMVCVVPRWRCRCVNLACSGGCLGHASCPERGASVGQRRLRSTSSSSFTTADDPLDARFADALRDGRRRLDAPTRRCARCVRPLTPSGQADVPSDGS